MIYGVLATPTPYIPISEDRGFTALFDNSYCWCYTKKCGGVYFSLDYGYQKSQCLCGVSDFKVRTKFLIGHHEIPKRYETFSKKVRNT